MDTVVLAYLTTNHLPEDLQAAKRAVKVAKFVELDSEGRLWLKPNDKFGPR